MKTWLDKKRKQHIDWFIPWLVPSDSLVVHWHCSSLLCSLLCNRELIPTKICPPLRKNTLNTHMRIVRKCNMTQAAKQNLRVAFQHTCLMVDLDSINR